jgi:hypothetical protein
LRGCVEATKKERDIIGALDELCALWRMICCRLSAVKFILEYMNTDYQTVALWVDDWVILGCFFL